MATMLISNMHSTLLNTFEVERAKPTLFRMWPPMLNILCICCIHLILKIVKDLLDDHVICVLSERLLFPCESLLLRKLHLIVLSGLLFMLCGSSMLVKFLFELKAEVTAGYAPKLTSWCRCGWHSCRSNRLDLNHLYFLQIFARWHGQ